jgi:peptide/nickel transport system substrate-binding protein
MRLHALKASDAFLLKAALLICAIFLALFLVQLSTGNTLEVASFGGTFAEGIVGTPRFINPVLAVTRADKDLTHLVYDGLMVLGKDGLLVSNVAESLSVSDDGLTYNVVLKQNVKFHDGENLTARDVAFTLERIQDTLITSPLRANFDGVIVEEVGEYELNFVLPEAYAPFIENLTFGILPEHIWKDASPEGFSFSPYNIEPIGSGPYRIQKVIRNASGMPDMYILTANLEYHSLPPKIETLRLSFFPNEERLIEAFKKNSIEAVAGIDADYVSALQMNGNTHHLEEIPLPRTFAVFFNQNKSRALRDPAVRKALSAAVDRNSLVETALKGYGNPLATPVPAGFRLPTKDIPDANLDMARDTLKSGGWKFNEETQIWEKTIDGSVTPLSFSIATVNSPTLGTTAEFLRNSWQELGVQVAVKQFEQSDLTQSVIRPRDYEALLFGTQLGRTLDFYSFWHSSQRNDPGLNISNYANITTDSILSEMRRSTGAEARDAAIVRFSDELEKETPAIFLYAPELLYVFPNRVMNASFAGVAEPHERWSGITDWYIKTESVWPFFTGNNI